MAKSAKKNSRARERQSPKEQIHVPAKTIFESDAQRAPSDLDKLMGYQGTIQGTPLDEALEEQRMALWEAQAIVDLAVVALEQQLAPDGGWPSRFANFPMALRQVSATMEEIATNLEGGTLEDRGLEIAGADANTEARS